MIYFGTDGIRGVAVSDITQEVCLKCGNALGSLKNKAKIIVGTDTRLSAGFVFSSFASGATLAGADIYFVGIVPTPAISILVKQKKADFGVMITASHNPAEYIGIKIFNCDGEKIGVEVQNEIERRFAKQHQVSNVEIGKIYIKTQFANDYVNFVASSGISLSGMKIALDCSNGASFAIAPKIFKELGAEVIKLSSSKDGSMINKNCGALHPEKLSQAVVEFGCDVGFAFDGDADRIVAVDEKGNVIDGDQILLFLTKMYKHFGLLSSGAVVATIQTNIAIENELSKMGLKLIRTDVGDQHVCAELKKHNLQIGGEQAGHIILTDYECTGDGILCAVQICKFLKQSQKRASELVFKDLIKQHSCDIIVKNKFEVVNSAKFRVAMSESERLLHGEGRIVARASGTEPKVRIMIETQNDALAKEIMKKLADAAGEEK